MCLEDEINETWDVMRHCSAVGLIKTEAERLLATIGKRPNLGSRDRRAVTGSGPGHCLIEKNGRTLWSRCIRTDFHDSSQGASATAFCSGYNRFCTNLKR
jgi:hypothetical protein